MRRRNGQPLPIPEPLVEKLTAVQNEMLFNSGPARPVAADSHRTEEIKQQIK